MVRRRYNSKKKIPERWTDYNPIKDIIEDAKIVAFKVPLPVTIFIDDNILSEYKWTPVDVMESVPNLGLVIDLTFKFPGYYQPVQFLENGIDYVKIGCEGHVVPRNEIFHEFSNVIETFHKEKPDLVVGIHCTHGVNRTGYMICRYLVEKLGYSADSALETFATTRGYAVERANYLKHIHDTAKSL